LGFIYFWQNNIGIKAAHKMLVYLTMGRENYFFNLGSIFPTGNVKGKEVRSKRLPV